MRMDDSNKHHCHDYKPIYMQFCTHDGSHCDWRSRYRNCMGYIIVQGNRKVCRPHALVLTSSPPISHPPLSLRPPESLHDFSARRLFFCFPFPPMLPILPRETHHVPHRKPFLRVRLQRAKALHPHPLPALPTLKLTQLAPLRIHRTKLRRGATAKVIHTHADAPQRQSHHLLDVSAS